MDHVGFSFRTVWLICLSCLDQRHCTKRARVDRFVFEFVHQRITQRGELFSKGRVGGEVYREIGISAEVEPMLSRTFTKSQLPEGIFFAAIHCQRLARAGIGIGEANLGLL
jgi:hypothetical protein